MTLEDRVSQLEKEMADLKRQLDDQPELGEEFMVNLIGKSTEKTIKDLLAEALERDRSYQLTKYGSRG